MIKAAVLTVLIETILFFLFGYRQKMFLVIVMLANLLTNVSLNLAVFLTALLSVRQILPGVVLYIVISAGEIAAVAVEYIVYKTYIQKSGDDGDIGDTGESESSVGAGDTGEPESTADSGITKADAAVGEIAANSRSSHQKHRLFWQVLLSNVVSFGIGLLMTYFAG